ncbi:hypothetical protein [Streptomyces sp. CBMA123]|uniref:hypothetical protein n=1 Tax=Streptomyces sp. CBMA123 TaxID=1896313 RepID=UPI001661EB0C|nr:hypothetical protein [Streptomyces sp. CBMA123]MBD0692120.1 hypothetical protein [Streptomyces sp. CBMA123]
MTDSPIPEMPRIPQPPQWPVADFDPVRRLRVIAATAPGAARIGETVLDAPFERVWALAQDLERTMPLWIPDVRTVRLTPSEPAGPPTAGPPTAGPPTADSLRTASLQARIHGHTRLRATFGIDLAPGWCLMQSRLVLGGMAARPETDRTTRFAFLGGLRFPGARLLAPALRPFTGDPLARFAALLDEG